MFTIDALFKVPQLAPLKKVYEANENDKRLVVVSSGDTVDITETVALHRWLETMNYALIPQTWETEDMDEVDVVHIRNLTLQTQRAHPFKLNQPLPPNSWMNQIDIMLFDAILYAQVAGEVSKNPTQREMIEIKNVLTGNRLDEFWAKMVDNVRFAQAGTTPKTANQQQIVSTWRIAEQNRFFTPEVNRVEENVYKNTSNYTPKVEKSVKIKVYNWGTGAINSPEVKAFRNWLAQYHEYNDFKRLASDTFGTSSNINLSGSALNMAHTLIVEALKNGGMLNVLASMAEYKPEISMDTGGGAYIGGNVNTGGGDFIGGNKYS